jgi:hypothetical protein
MGTIVYRNHDDDGWHLHACPLSGRVQFCEADAVYLARQFMFTRRYFETKALGDKGQVLAHWRWNAQVREPKLIEGKDPNAP